MTEGRVPPQNLDAEENVLGAMMLNKNVVAAVAEVVRPEDFYRESNADVFRAAVALDMRGEPVDAITLAGELERAGKLEQVGGKAKIMELAATVPSFANAPHYARLVHEAAQRRELIRAGTEITAAAWDGHGTIDELMADAERSFASATASSFQTDFEPLGAGTAELMAQLQEAVDTGKIIHGLPTWFVDFDRMTTGLYPGTLIVLAARPGVGKSILAQNICENIAQRGKSAAFFALEMTKREMKLRALVRRTKIDLNKLRTGRLTRPELDNVRSAAAELDALPLYVEDNPAISLMELRARARRMKAKKGLDLLVVDYLQLMVSKSTSKDSRERQVADLTRGLKLLAKELEVPIICISQLNRNVEYRDDKRPVLADLRESGAIEQDADMVLFLYREELYKAIEPEKGGDAELIIAKNRMGPSGTVNLLFLGRRQTFESPAKPHQERQERAA